MKYSFYHPFLILMLIICSCKQKNNSASTTSATQKQPLDTADTRLANDLSIFCTNQIKAAQLASKKASTQKVKAFGKETAQLYTQLSTNLNRISEKYNIELPAAATPASAKKYADLSAIKEASFDHAYLLQMLKQHNAIIREYNAAKNIQCFPLKLFVVSYQSAIIKQAYATSDLKDKTP